ncbi:DNA repair protein RecO [Thermoanaerobacterium sp. RBIITD]|uniref:DNA repair protein RecO n=1 Tax=Thermoanaerobacterium sp. RBIITD TaxID=1550240 RepID=UPI000BB6E591|nr:DNA repair protein RecO [Thermoanaerobacterium sp. RBIITD]SNX55253.1 DNA replication and repair protein RecO [Thermoanaerobacterium sp. RBIITD]
MRFIKTESIVLKSSLIGETDKIVTLFTKSNGKVQALAKGARNSKSRFLGASHPFCIGYYVLFEGQNYYYIDQWELIHTFIKFEDDILKLSYASYYVDMVYKLLQEEEKNINIYNLLKYALILLEKDATNPDILTILYVLRFVTFMGYLPEVNNCTSCGRKDNINFFSPSIGGVLCNNCRNISNDILYIKRDTLNVLRYLLKYGFHSLDKIKIPNHTIEELDKIITEYVNVHFEKNFQSKNLLEKIKNM